MEGRGSLSKSAERFSAIPADSITRALVVIPTTSRLKRSKSISDRIEK
jgi:hypothetical protein